MIVGGNFNIEFMEKYEVIKREEELKTRIADDFFPQFNAKEIIDNIDFSVQKKKQNTKEKEYYLWAESKLGVKEDIYESFVQLILTIGKAKTFNDRIPPLFLGAFDAEKMAFIPYGDIMHVFEQNDFNWRVRPSDHKTKEFLQLFEMVKDILTKNAYIFNYDTQKTELKTFIKENFNFQKKDITKIAINKTNFTHIYQKWLKDVKDTIATDWDKMKKANITFADFYLADILSKDNKSIKEKLSVLLETNKYKCNVPNEVFPDLFRDVGFKDNQKAHTQFWKVYERPPKEEYWGYIIERRDLLVPRDIRERKGSFFTPQIWVEYSQERLSKVLGDNWQDEYTIWDCAGGTGNLENGLTNKYNVWVSTLDTQDVRVMHDLIESNDLNLLKAHVFQFDFLNDDFSKLPNGLKEIIDDKDKRKKLIIYINPPYAEATSPTTIRGTGENKRGVAINNRTSEKYKKEIGSANNELFAQFFIRIYKEIPECIVGEFSTLKTLQSWSFKDFRNVFRAKLLDLFIVPAVTFDNVKGGFPIGFYIWDTSKKETFKEIMADIFNAKGEKQGQKHVFSPLDRQSMNKWLANYNGNKESARATLFFRGNDYQNQKYVYLGYGTTTSHDSELYINETNFVPSMVYFACRFCIDANWVNDRDQFFHPNDLWANDYEFHADSIVFSLFHKQNRMAKPNQPNDFIPFTEEEVGACDKFKSHFLTDFLKGKTSRTTFERTIFDANDFKAVNYTQYLSLEAQEVLEKGKALYQYYHKQENVDVNATYYDIRLYFQKTNAKGRMNTLSEDETYNQLMKELSFALKNLGKKLAEKVFEYEFLIK